MREFMMPHQLSGMSILTPNGLYFIKKSWDEFSTYKQPLTISDTKKIEPPKYIDLTKNAADIFITTDGDLRVTQ